MRLLRATILLLATWLPSLAAPLAGQRAVPSGGSGQVVLSFDGRATAGDFTGTTNTITGEMTGAADLSAVAAGWRRRSTRSHRQPQAGQGPEQVDGIREYPRHPVRPHRSRASSDAGGYGRRDPPGTFHIHGVSQEASIPASVILLPDAVRIRGKTPMNLKSYASVG